MVVFVPRTREQVSHNDATTTTTVTDSNDNDDTTATTTSDDDVTTTTTAVTDDDDDDATETKTATSDEQRKGGSVPKGHTKKQKKREKYSTRYSRASPSTTRRWKGAFAPSLRPSTGGTGGPVWEPQSTTPVLGVSCFPLLNHPRS